MIKQLILMSMALLMVTAMVSTNAMQEIQAKTSHSSNFNENKIVNQNSTSVSSDNCGKDHECKMTIDKMMDSLFGSDSNINSQNKEGDENSLNGQNKEGDENSLSGQNKEGNNKRIFESSFLPL